jgi:hypothetical protein
LRYLDPRRVSGRHPEDGVGRLKARLVIEVPTSHYHDAERMPTNGGCCACRTSSPMRGRDLRCDGICGFEQVAVFAAIEELRATRKTRSGSGCERHAQEAAVALARRRLEKAMSCRRWGLF